MTTTKKLSIALLSTLLVSSSLFAKDKDFSANLNTDNLTVGVNKMDLSIRSKSKALHDANVKLKVYKNGDLLNTYKSNTTNKLGKYQFTVNLPKAGKYNYLLSFNKMGGVNHVRKGSFLVN